MKSMKKAISLLLALVMCLGMLPMSAFAADVPEHEHNQNGWQCVYTEPVTETDCTHQHDGTCGYAAPTEGSSCTHEHNADCGYAAAVEGVACTCGAQPDENGVVTHTDDCAYVEAKAEVPCKHQHNETCGYVAAKAEVPCTHVCSEESGCVTVVTEGYWTCTAPVAEEVPAEVQAFLDAVAALPAPEAVTKDNATAIGVQVNAALDMADAMSVENYAREDVTEALNTAYAVFEAVLAAEEIDDSETYTTIQEFTGSMLVTGGEETMPVAYESGPSGTTFVFSTCPVRQLTSGYNVFTYYADAYYYKYKGTTDPNGIIKGVSCTLGTYTGSPGYGQDCLDLNIETNEGTSGTANVKVLVIYYISELAELGVGNGYFGRTLDCTVTVSDETPSEPGAPRKPNTAEINYWSDTQGLGIRATCSLYQSTDHTKAFWPYTVATYPDSYSLGPVVKNTGSNASQYPWTCTLTVNNEWWANKFSAGWSSTNYTANYGTHYVDTAKTGTLTSTFYWNGAKWVNLDSSILTVWVTHQNTYKIVRQYYINGELIATVEGGEESGTVGQKLVGQTIADQNPGWVNRTVDSVKHTFTYAGSYEGSYEGNKLTVGAKADSVTLTANTSTNVIVLRYEENTPVTYKVQWLDADNNGAELKSEPRTGNVGDTVAVTPADKQYPGYTFDADNSSNKLRDTLAASGTVLKMYFTKDASVDDGKGIEVTKTRTSAATAKVGDTITWNITVTNKSNVTKTVTLTELAGVNLSKTSVTLEAGESETVTATYTVTGSETLAQDGKFYNTVKASTGGTGNKENPEAKDEGTEITTTPVTHTVTVKYLCDENNRPFNDTVTYSYTLAKGEDYDHSVDPNCTMYPNVSGFNSTVKSPISFTLSTGTTWAFDKVLTTDTLKGTMGDEDITINVWYSRDQKGTIGTDPETGDPTDTPDGIPDKYQVKVTFKVENGAWDNETTGDVVKYLVKYASDGTTYAENGTATLGNIIPEVGSKPDRDYKEGYDADNWSQNEPTASTTIGTDTTYTYTYVPDTIVDDGKGISITKTRVSVNGDPNAKAAAPGDEIVWEITVTNNSNVEKTVTLTEKLTSAVLSEKQVTLAAGASKTVTATYTVKSSDNGKTLVNAVVATTDNPDDGKKEAKDPGTPIIDVSKFKVNITKVNDAPNGMHTVPDNPYKLTAKFTVTVKNESGFDLYGLKLTDALTTTIKEKGTDTLVPQGEANKGAVVEFIPNSLTIKDKDGTEHSYNAGEKSQSTVNGRTTREWTVLNKDEVFKDGAVMTLVYDVTVESWYPKAITIKLDNWAEYETDDGLPAANTTLLTYNVQAPRYFSLGLDNMFAGTHTGGAGSGTGSGTDGGSSTPETPTEPTQPGGGAGTSTGGEIGGRPDGGGGTEQPDQPDPPVDPNPPVDPVDPDPYEPIIPDEPTPVAPNPPEVEIDDERTPLASANGLNSVDHFAYIIGYDDDTVRPENKITRAEVATIFFRLMTDVYRAANWSTTNDFSDVAAGSWYNNAISTCAKAGLVNGYSDGTFKPDQSITRAEFATIAARFLDEEITGAGAEGFADIEGHWAETNILRAAEAGWVNGDNGRFRPDDYISRAEVMTIVNRMLNRVPDEDHLLPEMKTWSDNPKTAWYYEAVQEATNEHAYEWIDENVENWTELLTIRDWAALEKEWATAYSAGN